MNKAELLTAVAEQTDISKKDVDKVLKAFYKVVTQELTEGRKVQIIGFGTFEVNERAARMGRNPHTGETMEIPADLSRAGL